MDKFVQEVRYALRQLRKAPAFTLTAVLTLAFGIGANVAVFSVMNAVLLNPSGLHNPKGLVALRARYNFGGLGNISISPPDFQDALEGRNFFESAAISGGANSFNYTGTDGHPERIKAAQVSWKWFDVFQAKPILGRSFSLEDDQPNSNYSVVLSYRTWQSRFGADSSIVGRKILLNEQPYEVIGVMGPEFAFPNDAEFWTPLALPQKQFFDNVNFRHNESLLGVARLKDGVTLQQANAYLNTRVQEEIEREGANSFSKNSGWGMFAMPLIDFLAGDLRKPLFLLLAAVGLILLIASLNIAGLQLARASDRQRETSIRVALGAPSGRLVAQAFLESFLLACGGLAIGLLLAKTVIPILLLLAPESLVRNIQVHLETPVLAFVAGVVLIAILVCGSAPAWQMTKFKWVQALREGGRTESSGGQSRHRLRSGLVICEIAVAMLLLVSAGLLVTSLKKVEQVETGFDPTGLMCARVSLPGSVYVKNEKQFAFYAAAFDQLKNIPGATGAAIASSLPFDGQNGSSSFQIKEKPTAPGDPGPHAQVRLISPDYFRTLRIPMLLGREFTPYDRADTGKVAIVDETLAKQYFPNEDPIGKHIGFQPDYYEIVGVAKHARISSLDSDTSEGIYYFPVSQIPNLGVSIVVRTNLSHPEQLRNAMEGAIHAIDPNQPVYGFDTMERWVDDSLVSRRFLVILLSAFAGLALFLAVLGLYGVVTYMVKMRVREIGVRMALGAQRSDVVLMVLKSGAELAVIGSLVGIFAAFAAGSALSSLLYQVKLYNPVTLLSTSALLGTVVLLASYLPAYRASRLHPMETLRDN